MGSVVVVVVEPVGEGLGSGFFVGPGLPVGPFWFEGLAVAFRFAVLLGVLGFDGQALDPLKREEGLECEAVGCSPGGCRSSAPRCGGCRIPGRTATPEW